MIESLDRGPRRARALRAVGGGGALPHAAGHSVRSVALDGHCRIAVAGEADCAVVDEIRDAVALAVAGRAQRVTMDLRGVDFADSSFLKVLLGAKVTTEAAGIAFAVHLAEDGAVARMFALTGLTGHFATVERAPRTG